MLNDTREIDQITADTIEVGDQIVVDEDYIEVHTVTETDDIDEIIVTGYSHSTGDHVTYSLYADDYHVVWAV